ncbi:MAG: methoxymalonate biosynthesis acyl carrier protein [Cellvibrionaceae bacterium]|jgi:methoxymalonate biosynthesis acyl carrier protein
MIETIQLTQFITSTLLKDQNKIELAPDDNLLLSGLLSSLDVVRLVSYIEKESGIKIKPGEITLKNFKTINAIVQFVERKNEAKITA